MEGNDRYEALRDEIAARHPELSRQLKKIAQFALTNPNDMALETVAVIARRADVQPSALVRFAKAFGFDGFSDMQRIFRLRLVDQNPSYSERLRAIEQETDLTTPMGVIRHFSIAGAEALEHLQHEIRGDRIERGVEVLANADMIHIIGQRRSFPVAAYLAYGLSHLDRRMQLIDGFGGMTLQQASSMRRGDALLATSFHPYSKDTTAIVERAIANGIPVVAVTDSPLSPLASMATVSFEIEDAEVHGFRSLTATMCFATSLVVALGQHLTRQQAPRPKSRRRKA